MDITYLDIQRLSTEDGPGLRTTVFFKGCPMRCAWCHNPESISFKPEIIRMEDRCMACGLCRNACPKTENCSLCGTCADICPTGAISYKGKVLSAPELARELLRDKAYWGADGGITLSGGEAAAQGKAVPELLRLLKEEGVHITLDTCGLIAWEVFAGMLSYVDLFLYDLKLADTTRHKQYTGAENGLIWDNARFLHDSGAKMWIRTPVIPGATDDEDNIRDIGLFIRDYLPNTECWELCAFNNLCRNQYKRMGLTFAFADTGLMERNAMERLCAIGSQYVQCINWTGAVNHV